MQSDSDSEGEFFDATESQNNSFDAISSGKTNEHKKNTLRIQESNNIKHGKNKDENEILPQGKLKTQKGQTTENDKNLENHSKEVNEESNSNQERNLESSTIIKNEHSQIINAPNVDNNVRISKVNHLELNIKEHKHDIVDAVKTRSSSIPLSPVSEVLKSVDSELHSGTNVVEHGGGGGGATASEISAPIAPPRRKRKKKPEVKGSMDKASEDSKCKESPSEKQSSTDSTPCTIPSEFLPSTSDLPPSMQPANPPVTRTSAQGTDSDPVITLDYKSTEMKQILEKASSTEVIPALCLDARRKSNSVTSLGSSCNRSDSFTSVSSAISNGPMLNKSGSSASVASIHSFQHSSGSINPGLVRVRSESGRPLSDAEILEQVIVKNLDTGESIPLSLAEDRLPKGTNPLALHIMRLTSEFSSSNSKLNNLDQEDGSEVGNKVKKKTKKLKRFLGRTVNKMKADKKVKEVQRGEDSSSSDDEETSNTPFIKIKSAHGKGPEEFEKLKLLQDLSGEHVGAIWTVKFSVCGRLMATAGQDHMVRVWVLKENEEYFEEMRKKYSKTGGQSNPPDPEVDQILEQDEEERDEQDSGEEEEEEGKEDGKGQEDQAKKEVVEDDNGPFKRKPFCTYCGHTGDVLDLSWSKNYFLLSSSMDKTVRLWHISRTECLCCFQHIDFVTAIVFHPRDDRYFLSGSLDGKIRLWNIPDKKVALWNEVEGTGSNLITAANFCLQGRFAVVGTYDGRCIFYETERLKYHTQWQVSPTRNKRARGRKISGIEPMPGEEKVLITSNDSRIRLYDLKDNSLSCKYKGCTNSSSQIKASFSHDGQYLICGSEDHFAYIWRTQHGIPSARRDKNEFYESFSAHAAVVTVALFAPVPWLIVAPDTSGKPVTSEVLVTADWTGAIKLFVNR